MVVKVGGGEGGVGGMVGGCWPMGEWCAEVAEVGFWRCDRGVGGVLS